MMWYSIVVSWHCDAITITTTTIDLVRRLQIEQRRITMSGTLKENKTGTV